jgi:hypothetical protein
VVFTAFMVKGYTNIVYLIARVFTCGITIAGMPERGVSA